jgi:hypothetical protein
MTRRIRTDDLKNQDMEFGVPPRGPSCSLPTIHHMSDLLNPKQPALHLVEYHVARHKHDLDVSLPPQHRDNVKELRGSNRANSIGRVLGRLAFYHSYPCILLRDALVPAGCFGAWGSGLRAGTQTLMQLMERKIDGPRCLQSSLALS